MEQSVHSNQYIDLHVHSTGSDGTFSPALLVKEAKKIGLAAFALTDHDSVSGIPEAIQAGKETGIEVIPGVELSTEYEGVEVHVVGLYIDIENSELLEQLHAFRDNRDNRNLKMIDRLKAYGYQISASEIYKRNPDSVIARPHIARYLVDTHQVKDMQTVFDELIGDGCICYVDRLKISPMRAVELIHAAGGIAILAHPCLYEMTLDTLTAMIQKMMDVGLDGMEVYYSLNTPEQEMRFGKMADACGLLWSGGSDFHGANKPDIALGSGKGNLKIPYSVLETIKAAHKNR